MQAIDRCWPSESTGSLLESRSSKISSLASRRHPPEPFFLVACTCTCGSGSGTLSLLSVNPSISPTTPLGFGIGHSCAFFLITLFSSSDGVWYSRGVDLIWGQLSVCACVLLRLRPWPLLASSMSASAKRTRGAGQGMICGIATTRNDTIRVVPNKELVTRERGCKGGVIPGLSCTKTEIDIRENARQRSHASPFWSSLNSNFTSKQQVVDSLLPAQC